MAAAGRTLKVLVVYWHPEPKSFNGAMFRRAVDTLTSCGHEVQTSDLHAMKFDPVSGRHSFTSTLDGDYFKPQLEEAYATEHGTFAPELEAEMQKVEWADLLIFQFPLWWFSFPAVMKGWVDRVFCMKRFYGGGRIYKSADVGKKAFLSLTTGGPQDTYSSSDEAFNGDIFGILKPIHRGILEFCGFTVLSPNIVYAPVRMTPEQRAEQLDNYAARLRTIDSEQPLVVGRYHA